MGVDAAFDRKLLSFYDEVATLLEQSLRDGQALGVVAAGGPAAVRYLTLGAMKELLYQVVMREWEIPEEKIVEEIFGFLKRGYRRIDGRRSGRPEKSGAWPAAGEGPARCARCARCERAPARCERAPARCERAPARCERAPARCERAPARCEKSLAHYAEVSHGLPRRRDWHGPALRRRPLAGVIGGGFPYGTLLIKKGIEIPLSKYHQEHVLYAFACTLHDPENKNRILCKFGYTANILDRIRTLCNDFDCHFFLIGLKRIKFGNKRERIS